MIWVDIIIVFKLLFSPELLGSEGKKHFVYILVIVVQSLSHVWLFVSPRRAAHQPSLSLTISQSLLTLMSIESVMPSSHLTLCHPLLLLLSVFAGIRVFSNESAFCIRWLKYWSFNISAFREYSGLISFWIDWFDLFAVQGILKSSPAPQFKSINSSVLSLLCGTTLTSVYVGKKW